MNGTNRTLTFKKSFACPSFCSFKSIQKIIRKSKSNRIIHYYYCSNRSSSSFEFGNSMSSSWQRRDWWRWQQDSWQRDKWSREPWQQQPWQDSANSHWRGRARPGSGPAQIDPAQLRGLSPAASHSSAGSAEAAQKKGAWRDKKHKFEDHEVLRCPWPGGRRTFPEPPAEGCWAQLEDEALDLGLAPASVINHLRCDMFFCLCRQLSVFYVFVGSTSFCLRIVSAVSEAVPT